MQPQARLAGQCRLGVQQFADDGEDLFGMGLQRLAGQMAAGGHGQADQLVGDLLVQVGQRLAELFGELAQWLQGLGDLQLQLLFAGAAALFEALGVALGASGGEALLVPCWRACS